MNSDEMDDMVLTPFRTVMTLLITIYSIVLLLRYAL